MDDARHGMRARLRAGLQAGTGGQVEVTSAHNVQLGRVHYAFLLLALAWLVAMWPMFYNGFPLLYDDSGAYLGSSGHLHPAFPQFYTAFVFLLRSVFTPYAIVAVQALLVGYTLAVAISKLSDRQMSAATIGSTVVVIAATQLPWLVSTIMPDFLLGIGILALLTLFLKLHDLAAADQFLLFLIATAAAVCATANALVMIPFAILACVTAMRLDVRANRARLLIAAAFLTLAIVLPVAANTIIFDRTTYAIGSSARLFSKFVEKGIAVPFLHRECRQTRYVACNYLPRIRAIEGPEDFLWEGVASDSGAWFDRSGDFMRLDLHIISQEPAVVASIATADVLTLFNRPTLFGSGREIMPRRDPADPARIAIAAREPDSLMAALTARQQTDSLNKALLDQAYRWLTVLSLALALVTLLVTRTRDRLLLAILLLLGAGIVISTTIHGALSTPAARYFVKVSWLLWLIPVLAALRTKRSLG
jgi:hypothetical protein